MQSYWAMMGGIKAQYDCIKAFSETDFSDDLRSITVPVLVMHGDDDQVVPYENSAPLAVQLVSDGMLKTYAGYPHGMATTHADEINADILAYIRGESIGQSADAAPSVVIDPLPA